MKRISVSKKRIYALILVVATLFTSVPFSAFPIFSETLEEETVPIVITLDGKEVQQCELYEFDKIVLHAKTNEDEANLLIWQIRDPSAAERWINIYGQTEADISVTYALIGSMTDKSGVAHIRCKLTNGENEYFSKEVSIKIAYSVPGMSTHAPMGDFISLNTINQMKANDNNSSYETCSIVINYLFDNNSMAFEPYGASVAKGSDFFATVISPTVVGYEPYRRLDDGYFPAKTVELNFTNIQSDITINVIYEPSLVNFAVHHHLQNLHDDDYSISYDLITYGQALTETLVPDDLTLSEEDLPGFKALAYERLTVAADGSTVVEIRYDRNYYLVDFDMAGGYGVEPVYTRYGMNVGVNAPTRHGYVFGGWELVSYGGNAPTDAQKALFDINDGRQIDVPDANLRYRAKWITQETTYTMVFWQENAEDNGYSYWGYIDNIPAMSGSLVSGEDRVDEVPGIDDEKYFTYNPGKTDQNILVEGDGSTIVNVYYTRNYYKLTFKANAACTIPEKHTHGDDCYDIVCDRGHTHDDSCLPKLLCEIPEHAAHTDECLKCGLKEHSAHTSACCGKGEHTHTISCWKNIGNKSTVSNAPKNPEDGQIYRSGRYYIYIKGSWYRYNGYGASSGDVVDPSCGYSFEHTHGSSDCECTLPIHVHSSNCYRDVIHTHSSSCYSYSCGEIDHTHSSTCYRLHCGITENHTHSSSCTSTRSSNTIKTLYKKYGQSIDDQWPIKDDNGKVYNSGERWTPSDSSYYTQVLVYVSSMTPDDFTLTLSTANYSTYTMKYYLQVLDGEKFDVSYNGNNYALMTEIKANYNYVTKAEDFFDIKGYYQAYSNPAFSGDRIENKYNISFYYNRITDHVLQFSSNGIVLENKNVTNIPYGQLIDAYNFVPDYPSTLEPNAYYFAGWYTSPGCFSGTEVNWNSLTMPEGDLMLYAKWAPIKHSVRVFKDSSLAEQIGETQEVDHNAFAHAPERVPDNGNYVFQGWFYKDVENGVEIEKAFVFTGIPIIDDIDVYAKWSSHVSVNYTINYVLKGTTIKIADNTVGTAIAGHNKTFDAKAGTDLYEEYQSGYYPLANSHTITMSVDGTHEYTFEYVFVETMPYTVRYVDAATGEDILPPKLVDDNKLSVVTETFVRVEDMMPDAYQKRLILSAEDSDNDGVYDSNVITFYYSADEEHAYYRVVHYIQNIAGHTYREYRSVEAVGIIGQEYSSDALAITGFDFVPASTKINGLITPIEGTTVSATLDSNGMLIELYYDRITVNYTVRYIDDTTKAPLAEEKSGSGLYGAQIAEYALDLKSKGYTLHSENLKTLVLAANNDMNVIEFVYVQSTVSVKYQIIGPEGCGTLTQSSENVLAVDGRLNGSSPIVYSGYRFIGWYADQECTVPVNPEFLDSATNTLTPTKPEGTVWVDGTAFYALFEADTSELTIITSGISDGDQALIFRVQGVEGSRTQKIDLTVSVIGNGSTTIVGLPIGSYTVTEITDWSWRYSEENAVRSVTLVVDKSANVVRYENERTNGAWLDGNAESEGSFDQN